MPIRQIWIIGRSLSGHYGVIKVTLRARYVADAAGRTHEHASERHAQATPCPLDALHQEKQRSDAQTERGMWVQADTGSASDVSQRVPPLLL